MANKIERDEAEKLYVDHIMSNGNPKSFIYAAISNWDDEELIEWLERLGYYDYFIVEEK